MIKGVYLTAGTRRGGTKGSTRTQTKRRNPVEDLTGFRVVNRGINIGNVIMKEGTKGDERETDGGACTVHPATPIASARVHAAR